MYKTMETYTLIFNIFLFHLQIIILHSIMIFYILGIVLFTILSRHPIFITFINVTVKNNVIRETIIWINIS